MSPRKSKDPKLEALIEHGTVNPRPEMVRDATFTQSEFFDPRDLLQVKYEMLRRVRSDNGSVADAAECFGVSRPTYYKALSDFERAGLAGLLPAKRGPRGPHKLTDEVMDVIKAVLDEDENIDSTKLAELIEHQMGLRIHRRTIERALARQKKKLQEGSP